MSSQPIPVWSALLDDESPQPVVPTPAPDPLVRARVVRDTDLAANKGRFDVWLAAVE